MYKDFILTVDRGRPHRGNTAGRYRVCAKTEKQAKALLQDAIGFGKIQILMVSDLRILKPKEVRQEIFHGGTFLLQKAGHSTAPKKMGIREENV